MKKLCLNVVSICFWSITWSQGSQLNLPQVVPPSPEAAAINKNGELSVGLVSGAAQAGIPLYSIKLKGIDVPVSLSYACNGIKVDEIPSRFGMNWSLSCNGVVSRITHGYPDDQSTRTQPPAGFPTYSPAVYPYLYNISRGNTASSGGEDTEPDEFRFNAPGLSGKFIIADNGNIVEIPFSNNKIQVIGGPWNGGGQFSEIIITNTSGVKYYFGGTGAIEKTLSIQNGQYIGSVHSIRTAFFLKKILAPNGDNITYNYTEESFANITGKNNTLTRTLGQAGGSYCSSGCPPANQYTFSETNTFISYQSYFLSDITSSKGEHINFIYESRPDNSNDVRVKTIGINAGDFSKSYYLKYIFPQVATTGLSENYGDDQRRYFLSEVCYTVPKPNEVDIYDTLRYTISYDNPGALPARLSYAQDHQGYYNGQNNASLLTPSPDNITSSYNLANREVNPSYSGKGMLKRITFPTGGYEEIEYESNTFAENEPVNTNQTLNVSGSGNSSNGSYVAQTYYTASFLIKRNQNANVSFTAYDNPGCSNCTPPPPNTVNIAKLEVQNVSNNTIVWTEILRDYTSVNFDVALSANKEYQLRLTVYGLPNAASAQITFDTAANPVSVWANKPGYGVRVKNIVSYDPVSNKSNKKYYFYNPLNSAVSSGLFLRSFNYLTDKYYYVNCNDVQQGLTKCRSLILGSSSTNNVYLIDGMSWGYSYVIEANDPDFRNGGIEHNYMVVADNTPPTTYFGQEIYSTPTNTTTFISGSEVQTRYFNKDKVIVKKILQYYSVDTIVNNSYTAITAREKFNYNSFGMDLNSTFAADAVGYCYDVCAYPFRSNWIQLDSTVTIEYDVNNALTNKTTYYYGNPANTQPFKTESTNSTGQTVSAEMLYPTDYPSNSVYQTMVANNIIAVPIETRQKKNAVDISLVRSNYKLWFNIGNRLVVEPEFISARKGTNPEEPRIRYHSFDETGNPLEVSKENGVHISYIWDYDGNFPVAEIKNASRATDSIAYTSFESTGKGYWQFAGTGVAETNAPTGNYGYSLGINGDITRTVNSSVSYYLTYWLKTGSGSINVNGTQAKLLVSRNGWSCYQHQIQATSLITISGTATIDELRLYPVGSFITTYTYKPFVGISAKNEPNNQIIYYEYDGAMRLKLIRDMDRNIVKQFEYQYNKPILPCLNNTANWQATGNLRCPRAGGDNNNFTGYQEKEEIDLNNCSPTYLQRRWVSLGLNSNCTPIDCSGADKRVIVVNGVAGCYTGQKVLVSSMQISATQWQCTYHYVWSQDGYVGASFTETSTTRCGNSQLE